MATLAVTGRLDLTGEQGARLETLLPVPTRSGRPSEWTRRQLIDGIRWRVRVGEPWRDVSDCYGSWRAVYALFRRWQRAGAWAQIVTALQTRADAAGLITWDVSVDSAIARAHQHTAGARRHPGQQQEPPGGLSTEPDDHALGRSRGGLTTKIRLACEQGQKVLSLVVTAGQRGDSPQFQTVLDGINVPRIGAGRPGTRPGKGRADKACNSRANRGSGLKSGRSCDGAAPPRTWAYALRARIPDMTLNRYQQPPAATCEHEACDRLRRPSTRWPFAWDGRLSRKGQDRRARSSASRDGPGRLLLVQQLSRSGRLRTELILAVGVVLEVVLVFGPGLPEGAGLADLGHDLARPQA